MPKRILIVDDEPAVARVIADYLESNEAYEVRAVTHPDEAMEVAVTFKPDLAVLDIVMPGMDGGELLARLRTIEGLEDLPAIFLTGLVSEAEVGQTGFNVGGQPVIAKPVRIEAFREAVAARLDADL